jgi:hypothetical protein
MPDRRSLTHQAMLAAIKARQDAKCDLVSPCCIYKLCGTHGVAVQFTDIASMEGMYRRGPKPRIVLSALRPLARRAYTCGHELGHHVFGHGSTIDELRDEGTTPGHSNPVEILADAFAAFVLMPTLGLRRAFACRGWKAESATPQQVYTVANEFGVGYATLVTHLTYGLREMPRPHAAMLGKATPKALRAHILGEVTGDPLIVADAHFSSPTLDAEVGTLLLLPPGTDLSSPVATHLRDLPVGRLFRAIQPGLARAVVPGTPWAAFVRVSRAQYVGLAQYRHLEDVTDE